MQGLLPGTITGIAENTKGKTKFNKTDRTGNLDN